MRSFTQGSASDCVLVSLLAARHRTIKEMKSKFDFPLKDIEDAVLLSKLVAYCSKLVSGGDSVRTQTFLTYDTIRLLNRMHVTVVGRRIHVLRRLV